MAKARRNLLAAVPVLLAAAILSVMALIAGKDTKALMTRKEDLPPTIDFTWSPAGAVTLKEMRGFLTMKDDYALDFTTYRLRIVELDKTVNLPIDGLIGKDYEQPISFGLLADDPRVVGLDKLTIRISVADDKGQKASIERVVKIKPEPIGAAALILTK